MHAKHPHDVDTSIFLDTLRAMGPTQHTFPTHNSTNTIDLIIMEILSLVKVVKCMSGPFIFGHALVEWYLSLKKEDILKKVISIRNLKSINFDAFVADVDLD